MDHDFLKIHTLYTIALTLEYVKNCICLITAISLNWRRQSNRCDLKNSSFVYWSKTETKKAKKEAEKKKLNI